MNVAELVVDVLQYEGEVTSTINVITDIVKGRVTTTPELTIVPFQSNGKKYELMLVARELSDNANPAVATAAGAVDVGTAVDQAGA